MYVFIAHETELSGHSISIGALGGANIATAEGVRTVDKAFQHAYTELVKADKLTNKRVDDMRSEVRGEVVDVKKRVQGLDAVCEVLTRKTTALLAEGGKVRGGGGEGVAGGGGVGGGGGAQRK